ncbi:MAG: ATP-binding protein [Campylobacterales bacterium]|nr:ATP-binding protein [Campylobacterales bacterium]
MSLFHRIILLSLTPVILLSVFYYYQVNTLLNEINEDIESEIIITRNRLNEGINKQINKIEQMSNLLANMKETYKSIEILDGDYLYLLGASYVSLGVDQVLFIEKDNTVIARATDEYRFGNKLVTDIFESEKKVIGFYSLDNICYLLSASPILKHDKEFVGYVVVGIEIKNTLLKKLSKELKIEMDLFVNKNKFSSYHKSNDFIDWDTSSFIGKNSLDQEVGITIYQDNQPKKQKYQTIKNNILIALLLSTVISLLIIVNSVRTHIIAPIELLLDDMKNFMNGKRTDSQLPYVSSELSIIIRTYQKLKKENTSLLENLEKKVHERTKELNNANNALAELNRNLSTKVQQEVEKNRKNELQLFEQAKMASLGEMIGNIAHQWRQPLTAISIASGKLKIDRELEMMTEEGVIKTLDGIEDQVGYLSKTIDTFRNFLIKTGKVQDVILQKYLEEALDIVQSTMVHHYIELTRDLNSIEPIPMVMEEDGLSQVMINIINNAKDALLENKVEKPWIKVTLDRKDDTVIITIEDNGGGIPEGIIEKVFEPYFTTKHQSKGTGLGLHMGYRIITENLKGKIYTRNTQVGAKFYIELPISENNQKEE